MVITVEYKLQWTVIRGEWYLYSKSNYNQNLVTIEKYFKSKGNYTQKVVAISQ